MVGNGSGELITPLVPSTQPAGSHQQVMSPTLNYGSAGHGTNVQSSTQTSGNAQPEGMGFELRATGGALDGVGQREQTRSSGEASQVSTTGKGGESEARHNAPQPSQAPGGSSGLQAFTCMSGAGTQQRRGEGEALPGGVGAGNSPIEGFVTPRSQQGMPTIAEMVEGIPSANQLMSRVGSLLRVARTEVMQVPTVHVTPQRNTTQLTGSPDGALGNLALGDGSLGSHGSSPPHVRSHGTPASFAPPLPGRDSSNLLSPETLQRMQALEQRAPLLYGYQKDRPSSRSNSSSLPQEAIQAEVARQLAGFDSRAQAQDMEIQRLKRQLEEASQREHAVREQMMREVAMASHAPQVAPSVPQHNPQVAPSQDSQVQVITPMTHIHGVAGQAVDALRGPAQSAASIPGLLSNLWSGFGGMSGSQRDTDTASNPPCQQVNPHSDRYPGHRFIRLLRHQAQAHKEPAHQGMQPLQPCQEV